MQGFPSPTNDSIFTFRPVDYDPTKQSATCPYLTPPLSESELNLEQNPTPRLQIVISTAFHPCSHVARTHPTDLIIESGDSVFFYVHSDTLFAKSSNRFGGLIGRLTTTTATSPMHASESSSPNSTYVNTPSLTPGSVQIDLSPPFSTNSSPLLASQPDQPRHQNIDLQGSVTPMFSVPELSPVVNIALHLIYGLQFGCYSPDWDILVQVLPFLSRYGFKPAELVPPNSEMYQLLLAHAPERPVAVYALAAENGLHNLAVSASQYTLGTSLSTVSDQQAIQMGSLYLKWLFFLHLGRSEALKRILVKPFEHHAHGLGDCSSEDRKGLARAWGLVTAFILSTTGGIQNVSVSTLNQAYNSIASSVECQLCKDTFKEQTNVVLREWSMVRATI